VAGRKARGPTIGKQRCWWSAVAERRLEEPATRKCRSRIPISQDPTAAIRVRPQYSVFLCTAVIIITPAGVFLSPLARPIPPGPPPILRGSSSSSRPAVRCSNFVRGKKSRSAEETNPISTTIPIRGTQRVIVEIPIALCYHNSDGTFFLTHRRTTRNVIVRASFLVYTVYTLLDYSGAFADVLRVVARSSPKIHVALFLAFLTL